ncbi:hypothetical protein [Dialister sp.]|uniref:hypothetical protein n=1 Tax=Dialister sp. TaxID=1955814 RepID=UPI003F066F78
MENRLSIKSALMLSGIRENHQTHGPAHLWTGEINGILKQSGGLSGVFRVEQAIENRTVRIT